MSTEIVRVPLVALVFRGHMFDVDHATVLCTDRTIAERLADAGARGAAAERDYDRAANELRALIGDARGLKGTNWKATWSNADGSPRWKDIAKELGADTRPDLVAKHTAAPSRRFTFTKGK